MKSNIRWNLIGNSVYVLGQWVQLVILAHAGGPAAVGQYAFALALTAPVMVFASLNLRFLQASDVRGTYNFREYLSLRGATTAAAILVVVMIAGATGTGPGGWHVLAPVCAMRAADALSDIYYGVWQQHERMNVAAWGLVLNAASSTAFMSVALILGGGVPAAAVGAASGSAVALLFVRARSALDPELRGAIASGVRPVAWPRMFRLSSEAAPLGFTILLGSLGQNIPRYIVQHYAGSAGLGFFVATGQLTAAGDFVTAAIGTAATPRLASLHATGDEESFQNLSRKLVSAAALLGLAGVTLSTLAGRQFLVMFYGPKFGSSARMLVVLSAAAGAGFLVSLVGYSLTAARVIAIQPVLSSVAVTLLAAWCFAAVPRWGGIGAAWALLAANSVYALASWIVLRHCSGKAAASKALRENSCGKRHDSLCPNGQISKSTPD